MRETLDVRRETKKQKSEAAGDRLQEAGKP